MTSIYRKFTNLQREQIAERAKSERGQICCEGCGLVLGVKPYEIDHIIPEKLRPDADKKQPLKIVDGQLLGIACCHRGEDGKTAKDVARIAKAKRCSARHNGWKPKRPSIQSRSFAKAEPQKTASRPLKKTVQRIKP